VAEAGVGGAKALRGLDADFPLLMGLFELPQRMPQKDDDFYVGWGSLEGDGFPVLTFRLQVGSEMFYWLANPADPCVWHAMRQWDSAGCICLLVADVHHGAAFIVRRDFELPPGTLRLDMSSHPDAPMVDRFDVTCDYLLARSQLANIASSDLPHWPSLKGVQGCAVATPLVPRPMLPEPPELAGPGLDAVVPRTIH